MYLYLYISYVFIYLRIDDTPEAAGMSHISTYKECTEEPVTSLNLNHNSILEIQQDVGYYDQCGFDNEEKMATLVDKYHDDIIAD